MEGHFEAEELAYRLRKKGNRISKATVYRTSPLLVRAGLIKEVIHGERHQHYEDSLHDHLICLKCGKIVEFKEKVLNRNREKGLCKVSVSAPEDFDRNLRLLQKVPINFLNCN